MQKHKSLAVVLNMKFILVLILATILTASSAEAALKQSSRKGLNNVRSVSKRANNNNHVSKRRNVEKTSGLGYSDNTAVKIKVVRQVVNKAKYVAISTHSTLPGLEDYVFANLQIVADGGRGVPYTYMARTDQTVVDLFENDGASILFSEATVDGNVCDNYELQAKDFKCVRALLIGHLSRVANGTEDYDFGCAALAAKVPGFKNVDHSLYDVGKMEIKAVVARGDDGKAEILPLEDYLNYPQINN